MKQTQALLINKQKQQNNTRQTYLRVIKIYISLIQNGLCVMADLNQQTRTVWHLTQMKRTNAQAITVFFLHFFELERTVKTHKALNRLQIMSLSQITHKMHSDLFLQ